MSVNPYCDLFDYSKMPSKFKYFVADYYTLKFNRLKKCVVCADNLTGLVSFFIIIVGYYRLTYKAT